MRTILLATLLVSACNSGASQLPDPPVLTVTSPMRSLIQNGAAKVTVTGSVAPNPEGTPVTKVSVNNIVANVAADGSFSIDIDVKPGAMLLHTEALDANGGKATDTRSVEAGQLLAPTANIKSAVTTALSKEAFAKISAAAGPIIKGFDLKPMQGLYAAGEATGGVHGAVRLGSVAMVDCVVFGRIAGKSVAKEKAWG